MKIFTYIVLFIAISNEEPHAEKIMDLKNIQELIPLIQLIKSSMKSVTVISANTTGANISESKENWPSTGPALRIASQYVSPFLSTSITKSEETQSIFSSMSKVVSVPTALIDEDQVTPFLTTLIQMVLEKESIKQLRWRLNFVIIGDEHNFKTIVNIADNLDQSLGFGSALRHFSKWIWYRASDATTDLPTLNSSLDNVAVITKNPVNATEISTLLWRQTGREWSACTLNSTNSSSTDIFPNTKLGLNGRTLKIAILEWIPFSKRQIIDGKVVYNGASCDTIEHLAKRFNFSIEYVEPTDTRWGQRINESWTGVVGMLQRKEVDLCAVPYVVNFERSKVMTFSFPTSHTYHSAVYRKSEDERKHWKVLVSCFRWEVYLCGFVVMASVVVVLLAFRNFYKEQQSIPDVILLGLTIPLHQAGLVPSRSSSSFKVLLSFWWLFCIIITSVYTGNLVAQLSVSREYVPFRTLEELGQQEDFAVSVATGTYIELLLKMTKHTDLKEVWNKIVHYRGSTIGNDEFVYHTQKLMEGLYVLLVDEETIDRLLSENCELTKLPTRFLPVHAALPFPKLSPLAELFTSELMALTENGMISTWYKNWSPQAKRCAVRSEVFQFQLRDFTSAVVGVMIGTCFSFFILLVEYFMWKIRSCSS